MFALFTFGEILEVLQYLVNREHDTELLRAYEASYGALRGINFSDFKQSCTVSSESNDNASAEEIENRIEHYIDDYSWEEC